MKFINALFLIPLLVSSAFAAPTQTTEEAVNVEARGILRPSSTSSPNRLAYKRDMEEVVDLEARGGARKPVVATLGNIIG